MVSQRSLVTSRAASASAFAELSAIERSNHSRAKTLLPMTSTRTMLHATDATARMSNGPMFSPSALNERVPIAQMTIPSMASPPSLLVGTGEVVIDVQVLIRTRRVLPRDGDRGRSDRVVDDDRADHDPGDEADRRQAESD